MHRGIKHLLTIALVIGIVYFAVSYSGPVKDRFLTILHFSGSSVKGASTKRADAISGQIKSDINNQLDSVKKQALNVKVSDLMNTFSRLQKIPRDVTSLENYLKDQLNNLTKNKKATGSAR